MWAEKSVAFENIKNTKRNDINHWKFICSVRISYISILENIGTHGAPRRSCDRTPHRTVSAFLLRRALRSLTYLCTCICRHKSQSMHSRVPEMSSIGFDIFHAYVLEYKGTWKMAHRIVWYPCLCVRV